MNNNNWTTIRISRENALRIKKFHQKLFEEKKIVWGSGLNDVLTVILRKAGID